MQTKTTAHKRNIIPTAGYRPDPWAQAAGFSRQQYYALTPDIKPRSIKIGGMRIITESPADWLARIGGAHA